MMNESSPQDRDLGEISLYRRYPQLLPFVGRRYLEGGILLMAESHYLPEESQIHLDPSGWYAGDSSKLTETERLWTNTREMLNSKKNGKWRSKGKAIFWNMESAMKEAGLEVIENMLDHVAFMNAFQRPAKYTLSLDVVEQDIEISREVIESVVRILAPGASCFVSSKAARALRHHIEVGGRVVEKVPHPASPWWNRRSKMGTGRGRFIELIRRFTSAR
jgi:hypothetical protein